MRQDEEAIVIDIGHLCRALGQHSKLLLACTLSFACIATVVSFTIYHDKFKSGGTLLFNAAEMTRVVTDINTEDPFSDGSGGKEDTLYKNQEQLLKSRLIAQKVFEQLQKKGIHLTGAQSGDDLQNKVIYAQHVKDTDFIRLTATANNPIMAQKVAKIYLESYLSLMREISYAPLLQQKSLFEDQTAQTNKDLIAINQQLEAYQEQYGIVDITEESQRKVGLLVNLNADSKTVESDLAQKQAEVARLRKQLQLKHEDIHSVLQAVAGGQDTTLIKLQEQLQDLQKDYTSKALIYSPTNPEMQQLQNKVDTLKRQIADQQILTVGLSLSPKASIIKDSVRTGLVSQLASAEANVAALKNKLRTIRGQYGSMHAELQHLPKQQLEFARLQLEKQNTENVLTRLRQKLAEVQIQEAATRKKLMVIDAPDLPRKPMFPCQWQIIVLAALAGAGLSAVGVITHATLTHRPEVRPEFLENILGLPVLSIIPWIPEQKWQRSRRRGLVNLTDTGMGNQVVKAYQDLALNLKVQRNASGQNTFAVCSVNLAAEQSTILPNLAVCLAQSGERVLLIDANLHNPQLHSAFNHTLNYEKGLPELINSISENLYRKDNIEILELLPLAEASLVSSGVHPQLNYLNAGIALENTFEFLNSKGFAALIQILQANYDWVLLDAPPFLQQPDAAVLLSYVDGLLLLVEHQADEEQVRAVHRKVSRLNASIIGTVLRKPLH